MFQTEYIYVLVRVTHIQVQSGGVEVERKSRWKLARCAETDAGGDRQCQFVLVVKAPRLSTYGAILGSLARAIEQSLFAPGRVRGATIDERA
jgi:hypothetical protein